MSLAAERPQKPADAYRVMERLLGDNYFLSTPDRRVSVECHVAGRDRVVTRWVIERRDVDALNAKLKTEASMGTIAPGFGFVALP